MQSGRLLPLRVGVHSGPIQQTQDMAPYALTEVTTRTSLQHLLDNGLVLFTHGLMFTHGNWTRDIVYDYLVEGGLAGPALLTLPKRVFIGMHGRNRDGRVNEDWNYRLLAMPRAAWDHFWRYMCTVAGVNQDERRFHKLLAQQVPVPDMLALERSPTLLDRCPMVDVIVFGIDGNDRIVHVSPAFKPPIDKPTVRISSPDPDTVKLAERVFAEEPQPYEPFDLASGEKLIQAGVKKQDRRSLDPSE